MLGLAPTSAKATGSARTSEFGLAPREPWQRQSLPQPQPCPVRPSSPFTKPNTRLLVVLITLDASPRRRQALLSRCVCKERHQCRSFASSVPNPSVYASTDA